MYSPILYREENWMNEFFKNVYRIMYVLPPLLYREENWVKQSSKSIVRKATSLEYLIVHTSYGASDKENEEMTVVFGICTRDLIVFIFFPEISKPRPSSPSGLSEEDSVLFNKLTYLGCMKVSSPRSEVEALRAMATMRASSQYPFAVTLYVPNVPEGSVR